MWTFATQASVVSRSDASVHRGHANYDVPSVVFIADEWAPARMLLLVPLPVLPRRCLSMLPLLLGLPLPMCICMIFV
jgi:hypothetical protein